MHLQHQIHELYDLDWSAELSEGSDAVARSTIAWALAAWLLAGLLAIGGEANTYLAFNVGIGASLQHCAAIRSFHSLVYSIIVVIHFIFPRWRVNHL